MKIVGIISDTHGLLRAEALAALAGCDLILHAGDIGEARILEQLATLAPLHAVRGNNDTAAWARDLPDALDVQVEGIRIRVLHDIADFDASQADAPDVVVVGHSHRPRIERRGAVLEINPGSAGPRRFSLPVSVARMEIKNGEASVAIVDLAPVKQANSAAAKRER